MLSAFESFMSSLENMFEMLPLVTPNLSASVWSDTPSGFTLSRKSITSPRFFLGHFLTCTLALLFISFSFCPR